MSAIQDIEKNVLGRDVMSAERAIDKHRRSMVSTRVFADKAFPEQEQTLKSAAFKSVNEANKKVDSAIDAIAAEQKVLSESLEGTLPQEVGQNLDRIRIWSKSAEKARLDKQIDDVYTLADKNGVKFHVEPLQNKVASIIGSDKNRYQDLPPIFSKILDQTGEATSFKSFHSLWRETNKQLAAAVRAKDSKNIYFLSSLKDELTQNLNSVKGEKYGAFGREFSKWNNDYSKYAEAFYEGVGGKMHASTKYGELLKKEDIVGKFFTETGMDNFAKIYKNDPVVLQLLEDGILNKFHKSVVTDGIIDHAKANAFIKRNEGALNKIPSLKGKLSDAEKAAEAVTDRAARIQAAKTDLNENILAKIAKTDNPTAFIDQAFTDRKALAQIMQTTEVGRKAALNAMAHRLPQIAANKGLSVGEYLFANKDNIKPVLDRISPNHYKNMTTIANAIDMLNVGKPPLHPNLNSFNVDPIEALTNTSLASFVSQYRATVITRQSSPTHMATSMLGKFWIKLGSEKSKQFQEFLLTNPDAARDFAKAANVKYNKALSNSLKKHYAASGVRIATQDVEDSQE